MSEQKNSNWLSGLKVEREELLPKIHVSSRQLAEFQHRGDDVAAIVKVATPGYVPPGVQVRSWTGPNLYTANVSAEALHQVAQDPEVVSVELSKPLKMIK